MNKKLITILTTATILTTGLSASTLANDTTNVQVTKIESNDVSVVDDYVYTNKWYPMAIVKFPTKTDYKVNEDIDLTGLKVRFAKYSVDEKGTISAVYKDEEMGGYLVKNGWQAYSSSLKATKGLKSISIKLSFVENSQDVDLTKETKIPIAHLKNIN